MEAKIVRGPANIRDSRLTRLFLGAAFSTDGFAGLSPMLTVKSPGLDMALKRVKLVQETTVKQRVVTSGQVSQNE